MSIVAQLHELPDAFFAGEAIVVAARLDSALPAQTRCALAADLPSSLVASNRSDESLLGYALASRVIELCCGVDRRAVGIAKAPNGQPHVRLFGTCPAQLSLSVSHSDSSVAIAICLRGAIGVDVEHVASMPIRLAERIFAREDVERILALQGAARDRAFAMLWTVAEACAKVTGQGVRLLLRGIERIGLGESGMWNGLRWQASIIDSDLACAVAVDRGRFRGAQLAAVGPVPTDWILRASL